MIQSTTQAQPTSVPVPSSEDLARAQLTGVLEALKAEGHLTGFAPRPVWEETHGPALGVTVYARADYAAEQHIRRVVRLSMHSSNHWVDLDLETGPDA